MLSCKGGGACICLPWAVCFSHGTRRSRAFLIHPGRFIPAQPDCCTNLLIAVSTHSLSHSRVDAMALEYLVAVISSRGLVEDRIQSHVDILTENGSEQ